MTKLVEIILVELFCSFVESRGYRLWLALAHGLQAKVRNPRVQLVAGGIFGLAAYLLIPALAGLVSLG